MRQRFNLHRAAVLATALAMGALAPRASAARPPKPPKTEQPKSSDGRETPIDDFMRMSPEEQQKALNRLPADRRKKVAEQLKRFNALPEEERRRLMALSSRLHALPPERQEAVRKAAGEFMKASPERRQAMQEQLRQIVGMSAQERQAYMQSPEFRRGFSKGEQGIMRDMSDLYPPNPGGSRNGKSNDASQFFE